MARIPQAKQWWWGLLSNRVAIDTSLPEPRPCRAEGRGAQGGGRQLSECL